MDSKPTYGYRRPEASSAEAPGATRQRQAVYRIAKAETLLLRRYTGAPPVHAHDGKIAVERSDMRYCPNGFEISCDNGEGVRVTFSLDCCDRQAIPFAATTAGISAELVRNVIVQTLIERFGQVLELPHPCRSDNGSGYIAKDTRAFAGEIGLTPRRTPYRSPKSNCMAEVFVKTFKRGYVAINPTPDAATVSSQRPPWFDDYNLVHSHSFLGYCSSEEFGEARKNGGNR